jgi:hypothetical protein
LNNFNLEKSSPKLWPTSTIKKEMPKLKNRPSGGNSPNLVALVFNHKNIMALLGV